MSTSVPTALPTTVPRPAGAARRTGPRRTSWRRWISPLALLLLWQLASGSGVLAEETLASPSTIATTIWDLVADGSLLDAVLTSARRAALGFVIGAVIGVSLAIVAGLSRLGEDLVDPPMQMARTLPHFGLISLFILWMGIGETPKITLIALGVVFPLYLNTVAGIRGVDPKLVEAARTFGLRGPRLVRTVILPGALPSALTGLRLSLGVAWLSLIVAETISAQSGLGYLINNAREFSQTDVIVAGLLCYCVLGLLTDALVRLIERKALAWRAPSTL